MPKIQVSLKHANSDLTPILTRVRFIKEFQAQATDILFESGSVANITRLSALNRNFKLLEASLRRMVTGDNHKVQFVIMDDSNVENNYEINSLCFQFSAKLVLCWSSDDLVRYIESFAERPETVQTRIKRRQVLTPVDTLTLIPKVSSTDAGNLLQTFKTLKGVALATTEEYQLIRGISAVKAEALSGAFQGQLLP